MVDKDCEADTEAGLSFPQDGDGQVGPADADEVAFGMRGRYVPGGVEFPSSTGERRRTLGRGGLNDRRDYGDSGRGGDFFPLPLPRRAAAFAATA